MKEVVKFLQILYARNTDVVCTEIFVTVEILLPAYWNSILVEG